MFGSKKPIIAMLYLPPSLGAPSYKGLQKSLLEIKEDLSIIHECGFDACLLENEKDAPYSITASKENIASLSIFTHEAVRNSEIPVGFNFLLNDPIASLAIAKSAEASFIRSDYFSTEMIRDKDRRVMEVNPRAILDFKKKINADKIAVYADVLVKHATPLSETSLEESVSKTLNDGADGVIISGQWTGKPPTIDDLKKANGVIAEHKNYKGSEVFIGSGLNSENAKELLSLADGAIVGTAILTEGRVDRSKALQLMKAISG